MNDQQFDALLEELRGIKNSLNEKLENIDESLFMVVSQLNIMEQSFCRANEVLSHDELIEQAEQEIAQELSDEAEKALAESLK